MKLIIQIPCLNEAKTLPATFADLPNQIDRIDEIEYLIIDDGSIDNTVEVARRLGINHIVSFKRNKGLARGFMAGLDACLHLGADIIVNTDADNQYHGGDIEKLVQPILDGKADIVIGQRPVDEIEHWSKRKKFFQHLGSWVVRMASNSDVPDAPSGFRAYSREAALRINVTSEYTYTLETIIQAGHHKIAMTSVPIRTNGELRPSRLFSSIWRYITRSSSVILRSYLMYKPLRLFCTIGSVLFLTGIALGFRYLILLFDGIPGGHIQSLILAAILIIIGIQTIILGMLADTIADNRKIMEDIQYRVRKIDCEEKEKREYAGIPGR